jgi:hypothetical protein
MANSRVSTEIAVSRNYEVTLSAKRAHAAERVS